MQILIVVLYCSIHESCYMETIIVLSTNIYITNAIILPSILMTLIMSVKCFNTLFCYLVEENRFLESETDLRGRFQTL